MDVPGGTPVKDAERMLEVGLGIRSQRLSDTYPVRQRVIAHKGIGRLFVKTTQVKLLCPHACPDGHPCREPEGHTGEHMCIFGHVGDNSIEKCPHVCDCRSCEADCAYHPGHSGIHKCHFNHYFKDIPSSDKEANMFRDDKAIGDYVDELAYILPEDMRFANIPEALDPQDDNWIE